MANQPADRKTNEESKAQAEQLAEMLMPRLAAKRTEFLKSNRSFVHYTTGENAIAIIKERKFWMRSTVCMNDYSEVQHGHSSLLAAFHKNENALRERLIAALDAAHAGVAAEAIKRFDEYFEQNKYRVFIACLSEHDPQAHHLGRLSMWRAYGNGKTPVALVLNKSGLFTESDTANLYMSPVTYLSDIETVELVEEIVSGIEKSIEFLKSLNPNTVMRSIFAMLLFTSICLKHPGFSEEQEWRLVYLPNFAKSPIVEESIETINGVPQNVYKIPLQNRPDHGVTNIEIRDLIEKVIIGPTAFPFPVCEAFVDLLNKNGVPEVYSKVYSASIPLRV